MLSAFRRAAGLGASGLILALLLAQTGCRTQPLLTPDPILSPLGMERNRQAVLRGMAVRRWQRVAEEPGRITARYDKKGVGKHMATVDLLYDEDSIAIRYVDSQGLRCQPSDARCETIHRAYNRWVTQLTRDIEYGVHTVQLESTPLPAVGAEPDRD